MKPLYLQVYQSLKKDITSEKYKAGDKIPAEKKLSDHFQVSAITIKRALEMLVDEGFIQRKRGRGTFVTEKKNDPDIKEATKNKARQKLPLFGLVVTNADDSFGNRLITSLVEASSGKCFIIIKYSLGLPEREDQVVKELLNYGVDGMIIEPAHKEHYGSEILKMVINQFPLVLIDRSFKGVAANSVSTDNEGGAQKGINHLIDLGHEHIGLLIPKREEATTIDDRISGVIEAFTKRKIVFDRDFWCYDIQSPDPTDEGTKSDIAIIKKHLTAHPEITALFALEYNIGLLAKAAIDQMDLKIPEDISILSFDSPPRNRLEWNFTHIKQDEEAIGQLAMQKLLDMYEGNLTIQNQLVPAQLIHGATTIQNKKRIPQ